MKVMLLTASCGNGHTSAAKAIEASLVAAGHEAVTVDALDHTGKKFKRWYGGGYEMLVRRNPGLWGHFYKISDRPKAVFKFQNWLDAHFVERMRKHVEEFDPDWIVCTHSLPQPSLEKWRKLGARFKIAIVVTDLYPHLMWLRGEPDHFFVPGQWTADHLVERDGSLKGNVTVSGMPVHPLFANPVTKSEARARLGLETETPTVLVTNGGIGGGPLKKSVRALASGVPGLQIIVVCGRNARSFDSMKEEADRRGNPHVHVFGHVGLDKMADFMHASDLIVAKPGGLTTFEALTCNLPFVVHMPFLIPGQEEGNAEFLVENGAGVVVKSVRDLPQAVLSLLADRSRLEQMSQTAGSLAMPKATATIVEKLEELSGASPAGRAEPLSGENVARTSRP